MDDEVVAPELAEAQDVYESDVPKPRGVPPMPIRHRLRSDGVLLTEATGVVTESDLISHLRSHVEDPELRPGMDEIVDLRGVTELDLSTPALRRVILFEQQHLEPFRLARIAIVASTDLPFGLSRMYQSLTDQAGTEVSVHRTLEEAEIRLGAGGTGGTISPAI